MRKEDERRVERERRNEGREGLGRVEELGRYINIAKAEGKGRVEM